MPQDYTNRGPSRILTDVPARWPDSTWTQRTTYLPPPESGPLRSFRWGVRLFRARRRFAAAVTAGAGPGVVFAALQALLPGRRVPHVMIDCLWYREKTPWRRAMAWVKFRLLSRSVAKFIVWASVEVEDYARVLGLPKDKLLYLPFHHTLRGYDYTVGDEGYVFAGGDGDRDYASLINAARAITAPVLIATRLPQFLHPAAPHPPNVTVRAMTPDEFRQAMANARVVVVPMQPGLLHLGGQQTYLNAMAMGKAVIVCDERGGPDYIREGETGLVVKAGNAHGLAEALARVLADDALRERLAKGAAEEIAQRDFTTDGCMRKVVEVAESLGEERK